MVPFVYELVEVVCFHLQWIFCPWFFRLATWRPVSTIHHRRRERCTSWITFYIHTHLTLPSALVVQLPLLLLRRATMQTSTRKIVVHGISNNGRIYFFSERPQAIEGYDLAIEDAYTMQQLCAYEVSCLCIFCHDSMNVLQTAAIASSPNSLLKKKDLTMHEYSDTLIFVATHLTMSIWNRFNDLPTVSCSSDHTVHRGC